jgi:HK97 gp10 family phage protein
VPQPLNGRYRNSVGMTVTLVENHIKPLQVQMHINADLAAGRSARIIARDAASNAPVLTGALRDSIRAERVRSGEWVVVVGAPYGEFVEFGTMYMNAQPFLVPAAQRRFPYFEDDMRKSIVLMGGGSAFFG